MRPSPKKKVEAKPTPENRSESAIEDAIRSIKSKFGDEAIMKLAKKSKPKLIICGTTAYPRILNWKKLKIPES